MWSQDRTMLTEQRIQELISLPKTIIGRRPSQGFREESGSRRCDLDLASSDHDDYFPPIPQLGLFSGHQ